MHLREAFDHIRQEFLYRTGTNAWLPRCQWNNQKEYGFNWPALNHNKHKQRVHELWVYYLILWSWVGYFLEMWLFSNHPMKSDASSLCKNSNITWSISTRCYCPFKRWSCLPCDVAANRMIRNIWTIVLKPVPSRSCSERVGNSGLW